MSSRFHRRMIACFGTLLLFACVSPDVKACTTAVISGRVTVDGRPILWKNRDYLSAQHNEVTVLTGGKYRAIGVVNAGSRSSVWMGVNEAGLCIENSLSLDLRASGPTAGLGNGQFMKKVLQSCATVGEVEELLKATDASGRKTRANLGVIDATGAAVLFEAGPNSFVKFDANDPQDAPDGYIVRSNFSATANDLVATPWPADCVDIPSGGRYSRACELLGQKAGEISVEYVIQNLSRDLADSQGRPIDGSINASGGALPPTIATSSTISRHSTVSAAVFHGVNPNEDPAFTTMWVMLGTPTFSMAVPCWPAQLTMAEPLTGSWGGELGEIARTLRDGSLVKGKNAIHADGLNGIWQDTLPLEGHLIVETNAIRERWLNDPPTSGEVSAWHASAVNRARERMLEELREAKRAALQSDFVTSDASLAKGEIRVAVYDHSNGTASGPKQLERLLTRKAGFSLSRISPADIRDGELANFDVLIMPGGSGSKQSKMLEESGRAEVQEFVANGGGYVGICAGSYLASSHYTWSLNLINANVWDRAHWARGTGQVVLAFPHEGQTALGQDAPRCEVYYGQGPLLVPGEHPGLPRYEVLATYGTEVAKRGAVVGAMKNTHAIIRSVYRKGRVICFSPHPERTGGPAHLMLAGVRWAANPDKARAVGSELQEESIESFGRRD